MVSGDPFLSGLVLALFFYAAVLAFFLRVFYHVRVWLKAAVAAPPGPPARFDSAVMAGVDILFLRRLFLTNKCLWIGEWVFHVSFVVVVVGHLRYVLDPTPAWIGVIRPFVVFCGYSLFFSVAYVILYRMMASSGRYVSKLNLFLTITLAATAGSGLMLRAFGTPDLVAIKAFVLGVFSFSPGSFQGDVGFAVHSVAALVFIGSVPSHIMAAPATILEARRREDVRDKGLT